MANRGKRAGEGRRAPADAAIVAIVAGMLLSLAAYYLVPAPLLSLPPLLVFVVLVWFRLEVALCLLPMTFPFWYVPKQVAGQAFFPLSEIVLAVCMAVALAQGAHHLPPLRRHLPRLARAALGRRERRPVLGALLREPGPLVRYRSVTTPPARRC